MVRVHNYVVVMGGYSYADSLCTSVDYLDLDTLQWTTPLDIPKKYRNSPIIPCKGIAMPPFALFVQRGGQYLAMKAYNVLFIDVSLRQVSSVRYLGQYGHDSANLFSSAHRHCLISYHDGDIFTALFSHFYHAPPVPYVRPALIHFLQEAFNCRSISTAQVMYPGKTLHFNPFFLSVRGVESHRLLRLVQTDGPQGLAEVPCEVLEVLLFYFYTDQLRLSSLDLIYQVQVFAAKFEVRGLALLCEVALGQGGEVKSSCVGLIRDYAELASHLTQPDPPSEPDFTIKCRGSVFRCHSAVLCLRAEFFRTLLLGEFLSETEIELGEFSEETVSGVLRYMYCDDASCLEGRLGEVTLLAQFFGVSDLVVKCQSQLTQSVLPATFGSLYSFGLKLNLTYLLEFAKGLYVHIHDQLKGKKSSYRRFMKEFREEDQELRVLAMMKQPITINCSKLDSSAASPRGLTSSPYEFPKWGSEVLRSLRRQECVAEPPVLVKEKSLKFETSYRNPFAALQEWSDEED
jgi:hypothetical protein